MIPCGNKLDVDGGGGWVLVCCYPTEVHRTAGVGGWECSRSKICNNKQQSLGFVGVAV